MFSEEITSDSPRKTALLMGNEAIARGAIEAGVKVATGYPGTPSTEIVQTLASFASQLGIHVEWSVNECVALEVAFGAAQCGVRSLCAMKHNGLSTTCDMLTHMGLRDITGGMTVISADDPNLHSSQTETDTRWLARAGGIPIIEPSNPQEAKDFVKLAIELSEKVSLPIIIRTVTRLSHMRGNVVLAEISKEKKVAKFDLEKFSLSRLMQRGDLPSPFWNTVIHENLHKKEKRMKAEFEKFQGNKLKLGGDSRFGVIASGMTYNYAVEAMEKLGLEDKWALMKLATPYPFPEITVSKLLEAVEKLIVIEELEPFVEIHVRALAQEVNSNLKIYGKMSGHTPREGEFNTEKVANALASILGIQRPYKPQPKIDLFPRMLTMCAGCPHRATGYALKQAIKKVARGLDVVVDNDIGCYLLLMGPPFLLNDMSLCMGTSASLPQGRYHAGTGQIHIGIIGDSTFFHAGIPGLINAVHNKAKTKLVICDNRVTAMTGFQPHPGTGETATGEKTKIIHIEEIVKACGVDFIRVVDPFNYRETYNALTEMLEFDGAAIVISQRMCTSEAVRRMRGEGKRPVPYYIDQGICEGCGLCSRQFGCPAIEWREKEKKAEIVPHLCTGCGVCAQICPAEAILSKERAW